jgi:hypothetical protein
MESSPAAGATPTDAGMPLSPPTDDVLPVMQVIACVFFMLVSRPACLKVVTRPLIAYCKRIGSLDAMHASST